MTDSSLKILLPSIPKLEYLAVNKCGNLTDTVLISLAKNCPKLTHLDMDYNSNISDAGLIAQIYGTKVIRNRSIRERVQRIGGDFVGLLQLNYCQFYEKFAGKL